LSRCARAKPRISTSRFSIGPGARSVCIAMMAASFS
jgi:hypothetical protein